MKSTEFQTISLPEKDLSAVSKNRYRVYTGAKDYVLVEGKTAKEALAASGIEKPVRVERDAVHFHNIVRLDRLHPPSPITAAPTAAPPPAEPEPTTETQAPKAAAEPPAPASNETNDAPLTNDDIDALLKG